MLHIRHHLEYGALFCTSWYSKESYSRSTQISAIIEDKMELRKAVSLAGKGLWAFTGHHCPCQFVTSRRNGDSKHLCWVPGDEAPSVIITGSLALINGLTCGSEGGASLSRTSGPQVSVERRLHEGNQCLS